ncbi:MAG: hypothetical protein QXL14_03985 [Candidatus Aenigmatarchaeota archaeon]
MPKVTSALFEKLQGSIANKYSFKTYDDKAIILTKKAETPAHKTEKAIKAKQNFKIATKSYKMLSDKIKQAIKKIADNFYVQPINLWTFWVINAMNKYPDVDLIKLLQQINLFKFYRVGRFYNMNYSVAATATQALTANRLYAQLFITGRKLRFDAISVRVTTAATGNLKMAIYDADNQLLPYKKLSETGDISTSSTGDKIAVIDTILEPGLYWLAFISNAAPTLGGTTAAYCLSPLGRTSPYTTGINTVYFDIGSYTMPEYFPSNPVETAIPSLIALRVAEILD